MRNVTFQLRAVGDQRVVGRQLFGDAFGFEDALGAQHLLDLVLHRESVLEQPHGIRTDVHLSIALVRDDARAKVGPFSRIALERQQIRFDQFLHRETHSP